MTENKRKMLSVQLLSLSEQQIVSNDPETFNSQVSIGSVYTFQDLSSRPNSSNTEGISMVILGELEISFLKLLFLFQLSLFCFQTQSIRSQISIKNNSSNSLKCVYLNLDRELDR